MEIRLLEDERIDDLEISGLKIIQNKKGFCFGMDAVLLSGFAAEHYVRKESAGRRKKGAEQEGSVETPGDKTKIIDLGTGTGILPLLLSAKTTAETIVGLEIQETSAEMAARSVRLNDLEKKIKIVQGDIKEASAVFGRASFDIVTCNPPYIRANAGIVNPASKKAIARHEVLCTFADVAEQTAALLKENGRLFLVHRPQRLAEVISELKKHRLEPKRLRLVHSFADGEAVLFLLEASLGGNIELRIDPPLIIYKSPGVYTDEIYNIYGY